MNDKEITAIKPVDHNRIEKGENMDKLTPISFIDAGYHVTTTFQVTTDTYGNYSEGDKVQRKYTKGNLEYVEERPLNKGEEE